MSGFASSQSLQYKSRKKPVMRTWSLSNLLSIKKSNQVYQSTEAFNGTSPELSVVKADKFRKVETLLKDALEGWKTIVTIVLIEARGLPEPPEDGSSHALYCKFRLGSEKYQSKSVPTSTQPVWKERFKLHLHNDPYLRISLSDRGKRKTFMGNCVLDLSQLEKERTHELWVDLDDEFGSIHVSVTLCTIKNSPVKVNDNVQKYICDESKYATCNLNSDWNVIGELHVKVLGAKGIFGKPCAYCVIEVDNERVQTHSDKATSEPSWNKSYIFKIYDVTSTLDITLYDDSIMNVIRFESLGRISIPLLRIINKERRWFALKDRSKKNIAKGNCPRILLEMQIIWNPLKASLKLFKPKELKYTKKISKFDMTLVHSNLEFIRDTFYFLEEVNKQYKALFEWDNTELSFLALLGWLSFWFFFQVWMIPLMLLTPFLYFWIRQHHYNCDEMHHESTLSPWERQRKRGVNEIPNFKQVEPQAQFLFNSENNLFAEESLLFTHYGFPKDKARVEVDKGGKSISGKLYALPEMTVIIASGAEFISLLSERFVNLITFKVPFISYVTMVLLITLSMSLYFVSMNYLLMVFGIYKFLRKYRNPQRKPNNDLLDFLLHVPDNEALKEWKELPVPEPLQRTKIL